MAGKQYARSMDGLIDACFDQLQDLRDGISDKDETIAFAKTADVIVRGVEAVIKRRALHYAHQQRMSELANRKLEITYGRRSYEDQLDIDPDDDDDEGESLDLGEDELHPESRLDVE